MFIHIFTFRWKPEATEALKQRAATDILAFQGVIPGLLETNIGNNISPRGGGYTFTGLMKFTDQAAYEAYAIHPIHMALLEWLIPLVEPLEIDFEI
ncbi:Dabb family protein [Granulicella sp. WH15]|uniref:Dabb family protein n=1 Tax=Granulicella sp. WH15 TaxID=2602070 RepID=UPI0013679474|nr:Dabb family protein [Granulicella sp. WH15]QHN04490.1 Dabb family protein [Granulicella sp. WH15]